MAKRDKEKYDVVLVDFFDTLVFRHVTAKAVVDQWAKCITRKFSELSSLTVQELSSQRLRTFADLRQQLLSVSSNKTEVTYEEAIGAIYLELRPYLNNVKEECFVSTSKEIDLAIEIGCTYCNKKLVEELIIERRNGKKIYVVSDYYLPSAYIKKIMVAVGIPTDLFDGVYISCEVGKRKANGDLYPFVLRELGIIAEQAKMVGDNKQSDFIIPSSMGVKQDYRPNYIYKIKNHFRYRIKQDFSNKQSRIAVKEMFKSGLSYSEYINMFYVFTRRLHEQLLNDKVSTIAFMAREGYYLKELFELYQDILVPECDHINTSYYWCSRRSVLSGIKSELIPEAIEGDISLNNWLKSLDISLEEVRRIITVSDEEADMPIRLQDSNIYHTLMSDQSFVDLFNRTIEDNHRAFMQYTKPFIMDGVFRFVDSGWKCTTQNVIQKNYGIDTRGYYIGVQKPDKPIAKLKRQGIIFSEDNPRSKYYDYLGMNIPFYQQLLAAPHGTALKYVIKNDEVIVKSEWDPIEEQLFNNNIKDLQEYMKLKFLGLCVWDEKSSCDAKEDWFLAKSSMKSSLFAKGDRLKFIRECTGNYVQNFRQENRGAVQYDPSKFKLGVDIFWKPEKYLRYISKVQRTSVYDNKLIRFTYPVISNCFYWYTIMIHLIKG